MSDLLLEIFSEEIPAKMQKNAAENFLQIAKEILLKNGLSFTDSQIKTFITPQRLVLYIYNLEQFQKTPLVKKSGPKITADKKAIEGFLRSNGLTNESELTQENGAYIFVKPESKIKTADIFKSSVAQILTKMTAAWPKLMRFDVEGLNVQQRWIRPVRNIACVFGDEKIEFEFFGLKSNDVTFARSQTPLKITKANHFEEILEDEFVILNHVRRKEKIISQINKIKFETDLELVDDVEKSPLFDEVNGLCEWPQALVASIDERFLNLPDEVLILTLRSNQKYFCLRDKKGALAPKFIFISNVAGDEKIQKKIIADNEKVVRARLSDAEFFISEDLKIPLAARIDELQKIVFHQKLGSLYDKRIRLNSLSKFLSIFVPHCDLALADDVANLCKVDLTTKAVAELPELQGKIGSFYALKQGQDKKIVAAIYEHYLPLGPTSGLPQTPLGIALSIADKVDTIVGFFMAGEKPTSSKDPYALRRAVLGIIRIAIQYNIAFPIRSLVEKAINSYPTKLQKSLIGDKFFENKKLLVEEIIVFFVERLKVYLKENENVRLDIINVVIDQYLSDLDSHKHVDILYLAKKTKFLNELISNPQYKNLLELYKRSANILAIEEKKDGKTYDGKPSRLLKTKYEKVLYKRIKQISKSFHKLVTKGEFATAFELLIVLELPLDHFFGNVIVNDPDKSLRENRLLLLSRIRVLFNDVGDFSSLEIA
jgi:glycyl-tRNA synthetase beta chain